jgi:hypothetical protein
MFLMMDENFKRKFPFKVKFLNVNREWMENSQIHGLSFLSRAKYLSNRLMWSFALFLSIGAGLTSIVGTIFNYYDYNVDELIKIETLDRMLFPSVTFCNYFKIKIILSF